MTLYWKGAGLKLDGWIDTRLIGSPLNTDNGGIIEQSPTEIHT